MFASIGALSLNAWTTTPNVGIHHTAYCSDTQLSSTFLQINLNKHTNVYIKLQMYMVSQNIQQLITRSWASNKYTNAVKTPGPYHLATIYAKQWLLQKYYIYISNVYIFITRHSACFSFHRYNYIWTTRVVALVGHDLASQQIPQLY